MSMSMYTIDAVTLLNTAEFRVYYTYHETIFVSVYEEKCSFHYLR